MITYVAGFLFDEPREHVWLVRKARPSWMAGKLNAIGGKIETGEYPKEAQAREFTEETGLSIPPNAWLPVCTLTDLSLGRRIWFYRASAPRPVFSQALTLTDEPIECHRVAGLWNRRDLLPNFRVHLALALDESGLRRPVMLEDRGPNGFDPYADCLGSYHAAIAEIGRRVKAGEEPLPASGYFGHRGDITTGGKLAPVVPRS